MTLLRRACQNPALPSQSAMAPLHPDLESLTLENCRAFVGGRDAEFNVLTRIDTSSEWYAFVLKTEDGKRTKILENRASRLDRALELLHEASARVAHQYVTCHGYDLPPRTTSKPSSGMRGGLVKPDVIACGSSDSEAFASDSDDSVLPPRRSHRRGQRSSRGVGEAASTHTEREEAHSASDSDEPAPRRTPPWGMSFPHRPAGMHMHNPPQAWGHPMQAPVPVPVPAPAPLPPPIPGARPVPSMVPPPPGARSIPIPHPMGKTYSARLSINWPGNGKRNMLVNVTPTLHCLQAIATNEANLRPMSFSNPSAPPYQPLPARGNNGNGVLRATIRRVTLGEDDTYEMTAFGNDLTGLFRSTSSIPKFDIEIVTVAFPLMPPPPPPRPVSAASSRSSVDIAD